MPAIARMARSYREAPQRSGFTSKLAPTGWVPSAQKAPEGAFRR